MVTGNFSSDKKSGPFLDPFGPKFGHFCSKIRFSDIFFESAHQICLKLGQKLGTIDLNHRMRVLCLRKLLFRSIFGSKIHCLWWHYMVFGCFWSFSSKPLMFLVFLLFELCLWFRNDE